MKIKIEITDAELEEMFCDNVSEFEEQIRNQIDNGVTGEEGESGVDWMIEYQLEVIKV